MKFLTYHVVPGKVMSSDLINGQLAKTGEGSSMIPSCDFVVSS
ncbi:fasciclin domain-containing protein [Algoriphagus sp. C2-6-M1]